MLTWINEVGKHCVTAYLQKVGGGEPKSQARRETHQSEIPWDIQMGFAFQILHEG